MDQHCFGGIRGTALYFSGTFYVVAYQYKVIDIYGNSRDDE